MSAQPSPAAAATRGARQASAIPLRSRPSRSHSAAKWRAALFAARDDRAMPELPPESAVQLKEWKFVYLEEVNSPSELPPVMSAVKTQQYRWNKGGAETATAPLRARLWLDVRPAYRPGRRRLRLRFPAHRLRRPHGRACDFLIPPAVMRGRDPRIPCGMKKKMAGTRAAHCQLNPKRSPWPGLTRPTRLSTA